MAIAGSVDIAISINNPGFQITGPATVNVDLNKVPYFFILPGVGSGTVVASPKSSFDFGAVSSVTCLDSSQITPTFAGSTLTLTLASGFVQNGPFVVTLRMQF